ncbi:phosphodiesterase [Sphaerochaeta globosa]|uniref:Phosphoesterase n=1 Tax=Sphaerochaeta globosa (strain ATCC BAA-1886 / DSM 22777 / Buddy) TaxID=158189 RepID=F0RV76_SPHGB|nr:phosphodiesterase [Sphaerochaeta globosa]ADY12798.1 phosphodiesterase, MJ0936 family [Sphaerochaeta globosa str. Buddy]
MIYLFASDIHGSAYAMHKLLEVYRSSKATKLILLGDLLYHGPRNDLPCEYNPKETSRLQNSVKESLICVRGNCEAEVDQMVLEFPVLSDSAIMYLQQLDGRMIYLHHGHKPLPPLSSGTIVISGHTHIPVAEEKDGLVYINPGSVAIPKGGYPASYCLLVDKTFTIYDFSGTALMSLTI